MQHSSDKIFVIQSDGGFGEVARCPYDSEEILQRLLEDYPELLAGETFNPEGKVKFLLISREFGVPDKDEGSDRWSLDHLFLDQDATPTLVEVKRSSDTRIRREVVGQMLDYAANGQKYWPGDRMRAIAMERLGGEDQLREEVLNLIGEDEESDPDQQVEQFWLEATDKLRRGQVRLVFVADQIPPELRRILEFLNEHMPRIQVIGLELIQYQGQGLPQILVPRVVGQTEASRGAKSGATGGSRKTINEDEFMANCTELSREFFTKLLNEARNRNLEIYWGTVGFSIRLQEKIHGRKMAFLYGYPSNTSMSADPILQVYLKAVKDSDEAKGLRAILVKTGPFYGNGQYTLTLPIVETNMDAAIKASDIMFEWEEGQRN